MIRIYLIGLYDSAVSSYDTTRQIFVQNLTDLPILGLDESGVSIDLRDKVIPSYIRLEIRVCCILTDLSILGLDDSGVSINLGCLVRVHLQMTGLTVQGLAMGPEK
jgi:hypothetical protein